MKGKLKTIYLLVSSVVIALLHLPFAFGKSVFNKTFFADEPAVTDTLPVKKDSISVYDSLRLDMAGLSRKAFDYAQKGFRKLLEQGRLQNDGILAIADFSQSSNQKRLYVLDMKNYKLLFHTLVAHGKNSGREMATSFSNRPSSYKSSPGFYITGSTYHGSNGYSLKLNGIEKGINDRALQRAIVMHGADYVSESFIESQGYIGRSLGCPAVPLRDARPIINTIKDNSCLFIYEPGQSYAKNSPLLKGTRS